jgi:hypothetical protein
MVKRVPTALIVCLMTCIALLAAAVPAQAASKTSSHHKAPPLVPSHKLLLQGPITFWECSSKTARALIAVSSLTLHPGDQLKLNFIVRNIGTKPCNYVAPLAGAAGVVPAPAPATLQMGPCGAIGFEILGTHNRMVWPGVKTFNCPALTFAQLAVNATVVGSGTWDQTTAGGSTRVAPGTYVLMVDGHFAFALHLEKN